MSITYDRAKFFAAARRPLFGGRMTDAQVKGTEAILEAWETEKPDGDTRFIAYMLATTKWETDHTMQPIPEHGLGKNRKYGVPAGPWKQVYYGRGDVQLTWYENYVKADASLHKLGVLKADENLAKTPDLALRADVAAAILIQGMIDGWFTTRKLSTYFNSRTTDWVGARKIINGTDRDDEIAVIGQQFYAALLAARVIAKPAAPAPAAA